MKHCVKKINAIEFIKCMDNPKCNHCEQKPIQVNGFMEFIKQAGGRMVTPTPDPSCQGHYYTLLQCKFLFADLNKEPIGIDILF